MISTVSVVGTGLIGASWSALFLAHGLRVRATDVTPGAEEALRGFIEEVWPVLEGIGIAKEASPERLSFHSDLDEALIGCEFVQENAPERADIKSKLIAAIDGGAPASTIIASSSSGLMMSDLQRGCRHPERCVIGHPFNPPHLMPLVEVVGGVSTSEDTIQRTLSFYASLGKKPIRLQREIKGHVANRLQAAILRECLYLVQQGIASVEDVDAAVCHGPGLRWALMGPCMVFHLAGGKGGIEQTASHLMGPISDWWDGLGAPKLTPELQRLWIEGVLRETKDRPISELAQKRDTLLARLLELLAKHGPVV